MSRAVDRLICQALDDNVFVGCVLLVQKGDDVLHHKAYGQTNHTDPTHAVTCETLFDLASVTKLATTSLVLVACQQDRLRPSDPIVTVLPGFADQDREKIKILHLLQHTSGLLPHRPYYQQGLSLGINPASYESLDWIRDQIIKEKPQHHPGSQVVYSDLGFVLLDLFLHTLVAKPLDIQFADQIVRPLGLEDLFFVDLKHPEKKKAAQKKRNFAATEHCPWRNQILQGVVHDDNAYFMGGVSGHAGLFGTARDLACLMTNWFHAYRGKNSLFDPDWVRLFWQRSDASGPKRTLGFDQPALRGSQAGSKISRDAVGHLGFTGVSVWLDLERELLIVLLTNRVCPSRNNIAINDFRPALHDTIVELFD